MAAWLSPETQTPPFQACLTLKTDLKQLADPSHQTACTFSAADSAPEAGPAPRASPGLALLPWIYSAHVRSAIAQEFAPIVAALSRPSAAALQNVYGTDLRHNFEVQVQFLQQKKIGLLPSLYCYRLMVKPSCYC